MRCQTLTRSVRVVVAGPLSPASEICYRGCLEELGSLLGSLPGAFCRPGRPRGLGDSLRNPCDRGRDGVGTI